MKRKIMAAMLAAALLSGAGAQAGDGPSRRIMREAISLYEGGMYERAQTLFESLGNDAEARGYAVLCAATLQTPGYESLVEAYEADFPGARMADRIHYRMALNAFNKEDYEAASLEFMLVDPRALPEDELAEYTFKRAYSDFGRGDLANARRGMEEIQGMPFSDYTGPSRYALGYIAYAQKDFPQACTWFEQSAKDPRFADLSNYYLLECKFMQKDYRYVVENGIALYDSVPEERRPHLARILSESYLVMGDAKKARSYYDSILKEKPRMNRSDWFYAGSVLYAVEDWQGAVENFTMMTDRVDSLGQIANYQLGYAYIKTKNKVAAMDAFKDASVLAFDPAIQEDAYFNYAKLAFDLNHDTSVFSDYIAKYNNKQKNDKIWSYQALAALYNRRHAGQLHESQLPACQPAHFQRLLAGCRADAARRCLLRRPPRSLQPAGPLLAGRIVLQRGPVRPGALHADRPVQHLGPGRPRGGKENPVRHRIHPFPRRLLGRSFEMVRQIPPRGGRRLRP